MRIKTRKSGDKLYYSIIKDVVKNGKRTTEVYENFGTLEKIKLKSKDEDPLAWLQNYVIKLNKRHQENKLPVIIKKDPTKIIEKNIRTSYNCGYLFLKKIYHNLGLDKICDEIKKEYKIEYDLNSILSNLIYSRILYPTSKLQTFELAQQFIEKPNFELHHIYRALEVIEAKSDYIQAQLYKNSAKNFKRNNNVLYYDCTNYYFEIGLAEDDKQYGYSKENKPKPVIQMGLFMDGDGIPLAFDMTAGNVNEQVTLKPLEERIIKDFDKKNIVVCTDAGLASTANRKFNNIAGRKFITTQPIKKLKLFLKEEAIDLTKGWKISGSDKVYNIEKLRDNQELIDKYKNHTFYKERWIKEDGLEQRLIITYSVKYQEYQKNIRNKQIERAQQMIEKNPSKLGKVRQNDPKRFIESVKTTEDGVAATESHYSLNQSIIDEETKYDGLYAVCTNLEDKVEDIIKVNHRRWEIEESFRLMKTEFKARPVYLKKSNRIRAHFTTCFIALMVFRYLEKELKENYTAPNILKTLKNMNFKKEGDQYIPNYIRTDLTDNLHDTFNFRTDYETIKERNIIKICKQLEK